MVRPAQRAQHHIMDGGGSPRTTLSRWREIVRGEGAPPKMRSAEGLLGGGNRTPSYPRQLPPGSPSPLRSPTLPLRRAASGLKGIPAEFGPLTDYFGVPEAGNCYLRLSRTLIIIIITMVTPSFTHH